jgi:hypothetical protein
VSQATLCFSLSSRHREPQKSIWKSQDARPHEPREPLFDTTVDTYPKKAPAGLTTETKKASREEVGPVDILRRLRRKVTVTAGPSALARWLVSAFHFSRRARLPPALALCPATLVSLRGTHHASQERHCLRRMKGRSGGSNQLTRNGVLVKSDVVAA